jgi:hypothetical protein
MLERNSSGLLTTFGSSQETRREPPEAARNQAPEELRYNRLPPDLYLQ